MKTTYAAILGFLAGANAHMIMRSPEPIKAGGTGPDSSPLDGNGGNFPCKGAQFSTWGSSTVNQMTVGSPNTLSFTGSAVHGGGSCQVSLFKGKTVTAADKWMVIHSIEGGCPADTTASGGGNLPTDPNGTGAGQFQFTIPDHPDIGTGEFILAWSWHNKIGNREMYMNCAAVQVSAAKKKRYAPSSYAISKRQQAPLPDIFKANIGNGCTVPEGTDVQYPNPGNSVEKGANAKLGPPTGNCGSTGSSGTPPAAGSSSKAAVTASVTSAAANTIAPIRGTATPISQSVGGGFATVPAGGAASTVAASASAQQPTASATNPSVPISTGTSGTAPVAAPGGSCTTGDWNCAADGKSFTRCIAGGTWSASIPMSQGLSCTPGISANFAYNLTGPGAKRDIRSHIVRRRSGMHGVALS